MTKDAATVASAVPPEPALSERSDSKGRSPADSTQLDGSRGETVRRLPPDYFKLNSAFTCAVTVTVCGVNSSVGAGGAAFAIADIARAMRGITTRGFSNVSTEA